MIFYDYEFNSLATNKPPTRFNELDDKGFAGSSTG